MRSTLIRWDAPGPYAVAFSTRRGGVSEAPFDTLNLGRLTDDDPEHVRENRAAAGCGGRYRRRSSCATASRCTAPSSAVRGSPASRATASGRTRPASRCSSSPPTACPSRSCAANGDRPGAAALHVGWRGLLAGIVESGAQRRSAAPLAAAIGPGIGPCCYEVGEEVAAPFRERFGDDVVRDGRLDLWTAAERALRAAGVDDVHRTDLCTCCNPELFFSHRRDDGRTGRQGMIAYVC